MSLIEKIKIIERVDLLIRRKSTGNPTQLARKIHKSERYVFKLINLMKEMGAPIYYCNVRHSYCYEDDVEFSIGCIPKTSGKSLKGGKNTLNFSSLHNLCSQSLYIDPQKRFKGYSPYPLIEDGLPLQSGDIDKLKLSS